MKLKASTLRRSNKERRYYITVSGIWDDTITHSTDIKSIIRENYEQVCANKFINLDEMEKFLEISH